MPSVLEEGRGRARPSWALAAFLAGVSWPAVLGAFVVVRWIVGEL